MEKKSDQKHSSSQLSYYWRFRLSATIQNVIAGIISSRYDSIARNSNGIANSMDESRHPHVINAALV